MPVRLHTSFVAFTADSILPTLIAHDGKAQQSDSNEPRDHAAVAIEN